MAKFEIVSRFKDAGLTLPTRATAHSAGYDLCAAEDFIIPAYSDLNTQIRFGLADRGFSYSKPTTIKELADFTKEKGLRPSLVSTGMKIQLANDEYLELSVRSSTPLKDWLILANSVGIIDADYYNNPSNEGEIFLQLINLSYFPIQIHKGDCLAQGIIHKYYTVEDDNQTAERIGGFGSTS